MVAHTRPGQYFTLSKLCKRESWGRTNLCTSLWTHHPVQSCNGKCNSEYAAWGHIRHAFVLDLPFYHMHSAIMLTNRPYHKQFSVDQIQMFLSSLLTVLQPHFSLLIPVNDHTPLLPVLTIWMHSRAVCPAAYSQILGPSLFPDRGTGIQVGKLQGELLPLRQQPGPLFTKLPPPGPFCSGEEGEVKNHSASSRENKGSFCRSHELQWNILALSAKATAQEQRTWKYSTPLTCLFIFSWLYNHRFWSITVTQMVP